MPKYNQTSINRLSTCHQDLQKVFYKVLDIIDHSIIEGHREQEAQDKYFKEGKSEKPWPEGKHNGVPSDAVDAAPFYHGEISWDKRHCLYFAGIVIGVANMMGIRIRWGGDWDRDQEPVTDQDFQDLVHFERVKEGI
jgi:peptidoglycan L-alanyl-D-glutamate endopeptidase CwlK